MAEGVEAIIYEALLDRLKALPFTPPLQIAEPNIRFPPDGQGKPRDYLEVSFLPGPTNTRTLGPGRQQHRGIFQVSVHRSAQGGITVPIDWASKIIAHFPKDLVLHSQGVKIKIYRKPYAIPMPPESGTMMVPVTIQYESFNA